jgi:hypothetical protein
MRFSIRPPDDIRPKREEAHEDPETDPVEEDAEEELTEQQIASRNRQLAEMQAQVEELRRNQQAADNEKLQAFEKKKRAAVAAGDTEEYDQLRREEGAFYQTLAARGQQQQQTQDAAITAKWIERNRWMSNAYLQGCAQAIAQRYADRGITGKRQLDLVEKEMRGDPEFSRMIREYETGAHARTSKPSPSPNRSGKRDWNSIPTAERKMLEKSFIRNTGASNFMPDTDASRARLAKSWWDAHHPEE